MKVTCKMDYMWVDKITRKPMGRDSKSLTEEKNENFIKDKSSRNKGKGLMQEDMEIEWSEFGSSAAAREGLAEGKMNYGIVTSRCPQGATGHLSNGLWESLDFLHFPC